VRKKHNGARTISTVDAPLNKYETHYTGNLKLRFTHFLVNALEASMTTPAN